jgi:GH24 family phage-related lysozyme (muramidase)
VALALALMAAAAGLFALQQQRVASDEAQQKERERQAAEAARQELVEKVTELKEQEKQLNNYCNEAGKAIRHNAELKFKAILARHGHVSPTSPRLIPVLSDSPLDYLVSTVADALVLLETGGRESYEKRYSKPMWPGGESGVTIGIGFDMGYNTPEYFTEDWRELPTDQVQRLSAAVGFRGEEARDLLPQFADIVIPFDLAVAVFHKSTLRRFRRLTVRTFPNSIKLPPDCFAALVSLVFNRGALLQGERRKEMKAISSLMDLGEYQAVPDQLRAMKWVWDRDQKLEGLRKRREFEAHLFEVGLELLPQPNPARRRLQVRVASTATL